MRLDLRLHSGRAGAGPLERVGHVGVLFDEWVALPPRMQRPVRAHLSKRDNIHLIDPLGYPEFVRLMDRSTVILTDSGGIQEEAPGAEEPMDG